MATAAERLRLRADARREANWKRWGPYLSERQWATVREDYSADGDSWRSFPHEQARSRAYRWGEDGLLGMTDRECRLCFALALWNGNDPILKERLFGLTGPEGNHGEDVKEQYFYLDATPTHSYSKALYKYPVDAFPYARLLDENARRTRMEPEFELLDTGIFDGNRYFDVFVEYAKDDPDDILIRITVANRGSSVALLHVLPTLWFRNTWSFGAPHEGSRTKPSLVRGAADELVAWHESLGRFRLAFGKSPDGGVPLAVFTENETNTRRLWGYGPDPAFAKDAFHDCVVRKRVDAVRLEGPATKAALHYVMNVPGGASRVLKLRLFADALARPDPLGARFDESFGLRIDEADEFYRSIIPEALREDERRVVRQGYAGLLWSKQFYHYIVQDWSAGDPPLPPPESHRHVRNGDWSHVYSRDVLSVPDKWEFPWFAAWDLAFHTVPLASIDPDFAKSQLTTLLREWYMHPNGQLPAYEFEFGDVNPPVHAWAAWRVYKIADAYGCRDRDFLESVFQKLLLNFTWWVNRKDTAGRNLFSGGFLGLDNIGVFDRSQPLPRGGILEQADATAWMAFYCASMLSIALELAHDGERVVPAYEDMASKFLEHFVQIADAINRLGGTGLWDDEDGFYYDQIRFDDRSIRVKTRSLVGLLPLITAEVYDDAMLRERPGFFRRLQWFIDFRGDLPSQITHCECIRGKRLAAIPSRERLVRMLRYLLDEDEFLSPYGIRSLSKWHQSHPYELNLEGQVYRVHYAPGESDTSVFGGNSNWRGPVWLPINYLIIEALERYHRFYGDDLRVECPTGSGQVMSLADVAHELTRRVASLFLRGEGGCRACHGDDPRWSEDPHWRNLVLFHEYFQADTGRGLGASHQTGWTALGVRHLSDLARQRSR